MNKRPTRISIPLVWLVVVALLSCSRGWGQDSKGNAMPDYSFLVPCTIYCNASLLAEAGLSDNFTKQWIDTNTPLDGLHWNCAETVDAYSKANSNDVTAKILTRLKLLYEILQLTQAKQNEVNTERRTFLSKEIENKKAQL